MPTSVSLRLMAVNGRKISPLVNIIPTPLSWKTGGGPSENVTYIFRGGGGGSKKSKLHLPTWFFWGGFNVTYAPPRYVLVLMQVIVNVGNVGKIKCGGGGPYKM